MTSVAHFESVCGRSDGDEPSKAGRAAGLDAGITPITGSNTLRNVDLVDVDENGGNEDCTDGEGGRWRFLLPGTSEPRLTVLPGRA